MRRAWHVHEFLLCATAGALSFAQDLHPVTSIELCVTEGHLRGISGGMFSIDDTKTRATLCRGTQRTGEIQFRYLGPTREQSRLGSGEVRIQIGLKLRAVDPCNLTYVMWQIEPRSEIVVYTKSNPGQHTSAACENGGYERVKGTRERPASAIAPGSAHRLRAETKGDSLVVTADGNKDWEGELPKTESPSEGPVGLRTDNGRFELRLYAGR